MKAVRPGRNMLAVKRDLRTHPAQAAHVTLRAIVETLRTLPPLAVTLRCPDEKTLCAHTVDWNMFYQEEKPE